MKMKAKEAEVDTKEEKSFNKEHEHKWQPSVLLYSSMCSVIMFACSDSDCDEVTVEPTEAYEIL